MSHQPELFHESLTDALRDVIKALGGAKRVGAAMRPELSVDVAGRWLNDCLNPDRRERLDPDQVLWLLREGRRVGCHGAMRYIAREARYAEPQPIESRDQAELITQRIEEAAGVLTRALAELQTLRRDENPIAAIVRARDAK